jgi:glutamate carboxypeptidase
VPSQQLAEEMTHWFLNLEPIGKDVELTVDRRDEPAALPEGRRHRVAVREGAGDLPRDRQGAAGRAADRRRQRRQLHRRARHPDARRPRRRRQGRHAAYEQIYYSSLVPRTYLCMRLLETLE